MTSADKKIPLVEMFGPTIQGEGAVIGQQTYFMRFGLCDYRCFMCDSMHAVDPHQVKANAQWLTNDEIFVKFRNMRHPTSTRWVTYSGGNPCIHDLSILTWELKSHNFRIAVETQGTLAPDWLKYCDVITVSPKGPGMGENTDFEVLDRFVSRMQELECLNRVNMKIVVFDQRDLEFAKMVFERYGPSYGIPFYLSLGNMHPPGLDEDPLQPTGKVNPIEHLFKLLGSYKQLFEDIQHDEILSKMVFLPQWHTFVWGNEKGK